ncbi:MAG: hypothetical protein DLM54_04575 [Acidimicrobiales bacterium]|nr:MAG: hypothetical protein DLM54_04575 [Acidimicrobiales bacterium]
MEDQEVLSAYVDEGARRAFGPTLHVEGDILMFDGWWQAALRVSPRTFAVRAEEPPKPTDVLECLADRLAGRALSDVGSDFPLVGVITYAEIALGPVAWDVWSPDPATANFDLNQRAGHDTFLGDDVSGEPSEADYSAELGGARRLSGLPASLILTLGVDQGIADSLAAALPDCRFVSKPLTEVTPDACGSLLPTLMVVDATTDVGREFIMELRAAACGRLVPVAALTTDPGVPLGADLAFAPDSATVDWVQPIRALLP